MTFAQQFVIQISPLKKNAWRFFGAVFLFFFSWKKPQKIISPYGCFPRWWYPQIITSYRVFPYKPSILGCFPIFGNTHISISSPLIFSGFLVLKTPQYLRPVFVEQRNPATQKLRLSGAERYEWSETCGFLGGVI